MAGSSIPGPRFPGARRYRPGVRRRPIHVYHPGAERVAGVIRAKCAPDRPIVPIAERAALRAALPDVEVLFAPVPPRDGWSTARRLALLQLAGAGVDHLLPSPDLPPDVPVAGIRGVFADEVAEHVVLMLLALVRRLPELLDQQRKREWRTRPVARLSGRRLVVLGLGETGRRVAARAAALGVTVRGVRRRPEPVPHVEEVLPPSRIAEALAGADALAVCAPLTPETRGLVSAEALAALAPGAFVVDVSRGGLVDEAALIDALDAGALGGLARDVFEDEPLPADSPFWDAPNTIVTPHLAGYAEDYLAHAVDVLLDNVDRLERGAPLTHLVDRRAGY